jgi:hypothetical protein
MLKKCNYDAKLFYIVKEINATNLVTKILAFQPPKKCKAFYNPRLIFYPTPVIYK